MSLLEPTVIYTAEDGSELLVRRNLEEWHGDRNVPVEEIDPVGAIWRRPDGVQWQVASVEDGRLLAGLWKRCGPFDVGVEGMVPVAIATGSKADLAAYLYLGLDRSQDRSRAAVADILDLSQKRSVSNHLSSIRLSWTDLS